MSSRKDGEAGGGDEGDGVAGSQGDRTEAGGGRRMDRLDCATPRLLASMILSPSPQSPVVPFTTSGTSNHPVTHSWPIAQSGAHHLDLA